MNKKEIEIMIMWIQNAFEVINFYYDIISA